MEQRRAEEEATGKKKRGRKPKVVVPLPTEEAKANTTDPGSRIMKTRQGYVQGYNAQAVVSEEQIIVAVGVSGECGTGPPLPNGRSGCWWERRPPGYGGGEKQRAFVWRSWRCWRRLRGWRSQRRPFIGICSGGLGPSQHQETAAPFSERPSHATP